MGWRESQWAVSRQAGCASAKAVLLVLAEASKNGACILSHATIAHRADMDRRTVVRQMKALEARGLIGRSRRATIHGHRTSDRIDLKLDTSRDDVAMHVGGDPLSPGLAGLDDRSTPAKVTSTPPLRDTLAQEPVPEPINEPDCYLGTRATGKMSLRTKAIRDLPADFPDAEARRLIDDRFNAAGLVVDADIEAERFRDHHLARGTLSADWTANLRTWVSNGIRYARDRNDRAAANERPQRSLGAWSAFDDQIDYIINEERGR